MNGMRIQEQKEDLLKRAMGNHKHSETKYFYGEDAKKHPAYQKLVKNLALIDSKKRSERDLSRIPKNKEGFYIIENKNGVGVSRKDSAYDYTSLTYVEASPLTADDFNKKAEESVEKYIDLFGEYSVGTKEEQVNRLAEILKENTSGVDELISAYEFEKNVTNRKEYSQKLTIQSRDERRKRSSDYEDKVEASFIYLRRANALNKEKEKEKVQQEIKSLEKLTKESSIHERTSYASIESNNSTIENYDHAISNYTEAFRELNPDGFSPEEYKSILASNQDRRAFERNVKAGRVRLVDNRKFLDKTADKINDFLQNSKVADATFGRLERWLF